MIERILSTAMTTSTSAAAVSVNVVRRTLRLASDQFHGLTKAWRNRRHVMQLAELDDAALKDIGLTRADVLGALYLPRHRDPTSVLVIRSTERRAAARAAARDGFRHAPQRAAWPSAAEMLATGIAEEAGERALQQACC